MNENTLIQLLEISRKMAETRELEPLLHYAMDMSLELFGAEYGYLVLLNHDGTLDFVVRRDQAGNDIPEPQEQISKTIFFDVVNSGEPAVHASAITDPALRGADSVNLLQIRSVICVPLISQEHVIGALYLENRSADEIFDNDDLKPLEYFASHAAVCIDNALLNTHLASLITRLDSIAPSQYDALDDAEPDSPLDVKDIQIAIEQERMRVMASFIQNASHQFRTPMSVINTHVDVMKRKFDTVDMTKYLDGIQGQISVMSQLVDSLVEMVRLDSNDDYQLAPVDLREVAQAMATVFKTRMERKDHTFNVILADEPILLDGNVELLRLALGNLLDNALKYTPPNGDISLRVHYEDGIPVVEVADNGIGIAKDEVSHIFSRFYRVDKVGTSRGLGLGLSIVQRIMDIHTGYIEVESEPDAGSTFRLVIPQETPAT